MKSLTQRATEGTASHRELLFAFLSVSLWLCVRLLLLLQWGR